MVATGRQRLANLMNEFGEIALDSKISAGNAIRLAARGGGCVYFLGEFAAAVRAIIATGGPDLLVVETPGVAAPDAVMLDSQASLTAVRLEGVMTGADAEALVRFPQLGHTPRLQIEAAARIRLNKADLVAAAGLEGAQAPLSRLNAVAPLLPTRRCRVAPDLLCGLRRERPAMPPQHVPQPEFAACSDTTAALLHRERLAPCVAGVSPLVYRAKGCVQFSEGTYLFTFVAGRWDVEPVPADATALVFIGQHLTQHCAGRLQHLKNCAG
jgi:G3E family GTPase